MTLDIYIDKRHSTEHRNLSELENRLGVILRENTIISPLNSDFHHGDVIQKIDDVPVEISSNLLQKENLKVTVSPVEHEKSNSMSKKISKEDKLNLSLMSKLVEHTETADPSKNTLSIIANTFQQLFPDKHIIYNCENRMPDRQDSLSPIQEDKFSFQKLNNNDKYLLIKKTDVIDAIPYSVYRESTFLELKLLASEHFSLFRERKRTIYPKTYLIVHDDQVVATGGEDFEIQNLWNKYQMNKVDRKNLLTESKFPKLIGKTHIAVYFKSHGVITKYTCKDMLQTEQVTLIKQYLQLLDKLDSTLEARQDGSIFARESKNKFF